VIDFAVNSGHPPAIKVLQSALAVHPDGVFGRKTRAALETCDRSATAKRVIAGRLRFLGRLVTKNPGKHAKQAHGWMNRLGAMVEAL
jgi:lysozyme family protein